MVACSTNMTCLTNFDDFHAAKIIQNLVRRAIFLEQAIIVIFSSHCISVFLQKGPLPNAGIRPPFDINCRSGV